MSENETKGRCRSEMKAAYEGTNLTANMSDWILADAIDRLAADVAAIKERVDAISPEDVAHLLESEKAWVRLVEETRDEAIRERDEAREERDEARSEVERLRAELADAIDRITAVNAVVCDGSVEAERDRFFAGMGAAIKERDAATRERDEARAECDRLRAALADAIRERDQVTRVRDAWQEEARMSVVNRDQARAECERLRAELAARPAANSLGILDGSPEPRGWLTPEEKARLGAIAAIVTKLGYMADAEKIRAIINRAGSPPVVEVPVLDEWTAPARLEALAYRAALDAAGIPWKEKEVPRE